MTSEQGAEQDQVWALIHTDPGVVNAHAALDAHEAEEGRLTSELGRAIRRAQTWAEQHLAECDPWAEPCSRCGREPSNPSEPERDGGAS